MKHIADEICVDGIFKQILFSLIRKIWPVTGCKYYELRVGISAELILIRAHGETVDSFVHFWILNSVAVFSDLAGSPHEMAPDARS